MEKKIDLPFFCSPTALQRLFHHDGELAVGKAAQKFNTFFGVSSLGTFSLKEIADHVKTPKVFQFYFHKDRGLNDNMVDQCKEAGFDAIALTVDTITGGNKRKRFKYRFTSPPRLTLGSLISFALHPMWAFNYFTHKKFELSQLKDYIKEGSNLAISVGDYFSSMLDQNMNWNDAENLRAKWGGHFCLKGIMSVEDAKKAVDIGASAIMISNHGGRQLDGSRAPFDQLKEIVDAVGDKIDVICDGGIRKRNSYTKSIIIRRQSLFRRKVISLCTRGCRAEGVERALNNMKKMKLRGI